MKLKRFLCTAAVLAVMLTPLVTMAMIPSACGIFRHWVLLEGIRDVRGEQAKGIRVYRFDLDVDGGGHADVFLSSRSGKGVALLEPGFEHFFI